MTAYYNEIDPKAAAWLRELIKNGLIAHGEVDERSIEDVTPNDVRGFTQCHFFAGIGVWSHALRKAGWSDDRPCWTGSCPCQPFSSAGKGKGFTDERHLWPAFFHLIENVRPVVVFGEQVASKDGLAWLDLVQADLEGSGYASGAVDTCAAGFGAPHIRQRLYWVADAQRQRGNERFELACDRRARDTQQDGLGGLTYGMVNSKHAERRPFCIDRENGCDGQNGRWEEAHGLAGTRVEICRMADTESKRRQGSWTKDYRGCCEGNGEGCDGLDGCISTVHNPSPTNGLWRDADWLFCRDGKWRPVEPGTFPLAHGSPARMGRLRGYGNAIVAPQAKAFIEAVMSVRP